MARMRDVKAQAAPLVDSETSDESEDSENFECLRGHRVLLPLALGVLLVGGAACLHMKGGVVSGREEGEFTLDGQIVGVEGAGPQCGGDGRPSMPAQHMHLHFLMLAMYEVPHLEIWHAFFNSGTPGSFSAWVHCKDADKCRVGLEQSGVATFKLVPSVYSAWCTDLVSPMLQLLRFALAQQISPAGADEKFIFLSDVTLPLKPMPVIQAELGKHPSASDFCFLPTTWWFPLKTDNQTYKPVASQWSILSKKDAQTLLERMPEPRSDAPVSVPNVENTSWGDFEVVHCIDEGAIYSTLAGLFHLDRPGNSHLGAGELHYPEEFLQGCCRTLGFQQGHYTKEIDMEILHSWAQHTDLGRVMQSMLDEGCDLLQPVTNCPTCEIIWTVNSVNKICLNMMQRSAFLFMRKFPINASLPGFGEIFVM